MAVCSFVKTMKNPNIRKRPANEIHDDEGEDRCFLHNAKKSTPMANSKLYFSTSSADSTKESKKVLFEYDSCKEIQVEHDSKATATLQTETDISRDARAVRERALAARQSAEALKGDNNNNNNNKVYKGICSYIDHRAGFRREQTVYGPLRASAHIRVSARYDYQPDICKDYKATGCCGYGDSCKFMHDRGDYKSGWQMDREWEEAEKARKRNLALGGHHADDDQDDDEEEDGNNSLPIACQICKQPFVQAMVTKSSVQEEVLCLRPAYPRNL